MARPLRIEYPNAYYHVSNKAESSKLFPGDQYFQVFLNSVFEAAARLNVEVHCWSLLKDEYHLLVKTPEGKIGFEFEVRAPKAAGAKKTAAKKKAA